jgi:hypothetical protein
LKCTGATNCIRCGRQGVRGKVKARKARIH